MTKLNTDIKIPVIARVEGEGALDLENLKGNKAIESQKFQHNSNILKSMADAELQGTGQSNQNPI